MIKYNGLFYFSFPAGNRIFGITAEHSRGLWSDPEVVEGIQGIDPGHVADREGNRYLYVDGGWMIKLTPDGLSTGGKEVKVYDGWRILLSPVCI